MDYDNSGDRATSSASIITSDGWEQMAASFDRGRVVAEAASIVFGIRSLSGPPAVMSGMAAASIAAQATAFTAEQAAELCRAQAAQAREAEAREAAAREARQREAEARQREAREAAERDFRFQRDLQRSHDRYRESYRSGDFLRNYRDPPSRADLDRIGRTA